METDVFLENCFENDRAIEQTAKNAELIILVDQKDENH
jgi:hypothetical protein